MVKHNKTNPDLPLHLKVGINAGEPIVEDDDLFGTTVQVAARTVDKAKSEQIFVTEIVHGICAGKGLKFINRGQFEMKGVAEPITLFEAVWDESIMAAAEVARPTPAGDGQAKETAGDAEADKSEVKPGEDTARPVEDEAAVDKPDAESGADEKAGADQKEGAPAARPGPVEEVTETGEAAVTAPPQEPVETEERLPPVGAQRPPAAAKQPSAGPDGKAAAAGEDKA